MHRLAGAKMHQRCWQEGPRTGGLFIRLQACVGLPVCESGTYPIVDNEELVSGELPLQAEQSLLVSRLQQFMDKSCGSAEADRQPLLAGREAEPETDVGFASAGQTSVMMPGVRRLRFGSFTLSIRGAARLSSRLAASAMLASTMWSSGSGMAPLPCYRPG
jgi:hypothetical protein